MRKCASATKTALMGVTIGGGYRDVNAWEVMNGWKYQAKLRQGRSRGSGKFADRNLPSAGHVMCRMQIVGTSHRDSLKIEAQNRNKGSRLRHEL